VTPAPFETTATPVTPSPGTDRRASASTAAPAAARWRAVLFALIVAVAVARIADTYHVLNNTIDEAVHIAVGMEWVDLGRYHYEALHPPMRAIYGIGPKLIGAHSFDDPNKWDEGRRILYESSQPYRRILTAARVAALPFFVFTLGLIGIWAMRIGGPGAAGAAVFAYSMLPVALAHAGLATTDTPVTATLTLAFFTWATWLQSSRFRNAALFGLAAGLAMASKFSSVVFLVPTVLLSAVIWFARKEKGERWPFARAFVAGGLLAILVGLLVLWTSYRFSVAPLTGHGPHESIDRVLGAQGRLRDLAYRIVESPVPMPELVQGIQYVASANAMNRPSYLMGQVREGGSWAFFPVAILVKTPIPFLLLALFGIALIARRAWRGASPIVWVPLMGATLMLVSVLPSHINIGLRHVLPIFPLLAIMAGQGAVALWESRHRAQMALRVAMVALLVWLGVASLKAHPDYLTYFNECCSRNARYWLVDSDLDWGQDLDRLSATLKRRGIPKLWLAYFGSADPKRHGLPPFEPLPPYTRVHGWIAASEYRISVGEWTEWTRSPHDQFRWLDAYEPVEIVGNSIRLYHLP
jgi:hypothetical protein